MKKYGAILADPPWQFKTWSEKGEGRSASQHYDLLSAKKICSFSPMMDGYAADDCVLFLWATFPLIKQALETMEVWGFKYKTVAFTWVKTNKDGSPFMGLGYWTRANAELCLLGARGHPRRKAKDVRQVILAPRRVHSRKPDEQYERIERLVDGPYLELFARPPHPEGWDVWGDEVEG